MEIIEFDCTFDRIPSQDNPAFDSEQECLMIVRAFPHEHRKFHVLDVRDQIVDGKVVDRVRSFASFSHIEDARIFAEAYAATSMKEPTP